MTGLTSNQQSATSEELGFSPDSLQQQRQQLLDLLKQTTPGLVTDNQVNLDKLKQLFSDDLTAPQEHYELTWAGKSEARREIQKTTSSTLLPSPNNPAQAQHMLIEGENLEVLRVLQKSYYGKVKMIYIDPPYNTGNDSFVYPDDYSETLDEYLKRTGEKNEDGYLNKQSLWKKNSKESGQYHSAWLSMMYPRLYLARNLLRDDGVIFISIDDNEQANLKLLCDEVFGAESFHGDIITISNPGGRDYKQIAITNEHLLVYAKSEDAILNEIQKEARFSLFDDRHGFELRELRNRNPKFNRDNRPNLYYPFYADPNNITDDGYCGVSLVEDEKHFIEIFPKNSEGKDSCWRWGKPKATESIKINNPYCSDVVAKQRRDGGWNIYEKNRRSTTKVKSVWDETEMRTENGTRQVRSLFGSTYFDHPKPLALLERCVKVGSSTNDIILDFFAGSGTTAHAVMELNAEDGGNRQSISVQMPELLDEKSEAYKAGYRSIADITLARIEKVIAKLKAEQPEQTQDLACAHFKLAPSNFKVWRSDLADVDAVRSQLEMFQQAEKDSATNAQNDGAFSAQTDVHTAMLTELLLKNGLGALGVHAISKPKTLASGITIHRVLMSDDRLLWLCFDAYQQGFKDEVIKANPAQVIMLNSCFNSQGDKADEHISNLQLELGHHGIGLLII